MHSCEQICAKVGESMQQILDAASKTTGVSIQQDGWSGSTRRPMLNFVVTTPDGAIFEHAVDTSGSEKNATYLADQTRAIIIKVGAENVVAIITDSASVNEAAADKLIAEFPTIFWVRCTAHAVNLLLGSIGDLSWVKPHTLLDTC